MTTDLNQIEEKLDRLILLFQGLDARLDRHDERFDAVDEHDLETKELLTNHLAHVQSDIAQIREVVSKLTVVHAPSRDWPRRLTFCGTRVRAYTHVAREKDEVVTCESCLWGINVVETEARTDLEDYEKSEVPMGRWRDASA